MQRMYDILLCYRKRGDTLAKIYEVHIVAHSIADARVKLQWHWIRTHEREDYVIIAGAKYDEMKLNLDGKWEVI